MRRHSPLFALCLSVAAACSDPEAGPSYGDPTALSVPTDINGIRAWVVSPQTPRSVVDSYPEIVIAAYTLEGKEELEVELSKLERDRSGQSTSIGTVTAVASGPAGHSQEFRARLALSHGDNTVLVRIRSKVSNKQRPLNFVLRYDGVKPGGSVGVALPTDTSAGCAYDSELNPPITNAPSVCLHGRVTSKAKGTVSARIVAPAEIAGALSVGSDGRFSDAVTLPPDTTSDIELELSDGAGETQTIFTTVTQDLTPPAINVTTTARETLDAQFTLEGEATDAHGIADVRIETGAGSRESLGAAQPFAIDLTLTPGTNDVRVIARDLAGNEASSSLTLERVRMLSLGAPKTDVGTTNIEVDRQSLNELMSEADQEDLSLVSIDMTEAVKNSLQRIREPERYGVDTSAWGAPERNLQRILQMTPDVADLSGTSVEELLNISNAVGLPSPRLLADILEIGVTDYILDLDRTAEVIVDKLIGSHPNTERDSAGKAVITVSLADVMKDLAPLGARFGQAGVHPGFLSGQTSSKVMEPGFLITFPVHSNLVQFDAVDLSSAAKDYLFVLAGERVLDFNVLTDDFNVVGLTDEPTIDLRFVMQEAPTFVRSGSAADAGPDTQDPGFFRGDGPAFALSPWLFEHVAVETGYRQLHRNFSDSAFQRTLRYDTGSIDDAAVIDWNRGFLRMTTAGNLGSPPAPLFIWDLLTEVAQVRLHDQNIAEGSANMAFDLDDLPIGLTADELVERLRPKLHEQEDKLSEQLAGKTGLAITSADLFYVPAVGGGSPTLAFRAEADGGGDYSYAHVGFYADAALTNKLSTTRALPGLPQVTREQVEVQVGNTYYAQDSDGTVHALNVVSMSGGADGAIAVQVTHVEAP